MWGSIQSLLSGFGWPIRVERGPEQWRFVPHVSPELDGHPAPPSAAAAGRVSPTAGTGEGSAATLLQAAAVPRFFPHVSPEEAALSAAASACISAAARLLLPALTSPGRGPADDVGRLNCRCAAAPAAADADAAAAAAAESAASSGLTCGKKRDAAAAARRLLALLDAARSAL